MKIKELRANAEDILGKKIRCVTALIPDYTTLAQTLTPLPHQFRSVSSCARVVYASAAYTLSPIQEILPCRELLTPLNAVVFARFSSTGPAFDIRKFHDSILGLGPAPLHVVESYINEWVEEQRLYVHANTGSHLSWLTYHYLIVMGCILSLHNQLVTASP